MAGDDLMLDFFGSLDPQAVCEGSSGAGVKVAVVDGGVDADHPILRGQVKGGIAVTISAEGELEYSGDFSDGAGHGTACAGIIAGIAPEVELVAVKVLSDGLTGYAEALIAGMRWALEQGVQIINLSLGTTDEEYYLPLRRVTEPAYYQNVVIVAAAHNENQRSLPAIFSSVISVAGIKTPAPFTFVYRGFRGRRCDFEASGYDVEAPWPGGGYRRVQGNSFAAAHISGIIALMLAKYPVLTPFQVKTLLYATSVRG